MGVGVFLTELSQMSSFFSSPSFRLENQRAKNDHEDSRDCFEIDEPKEMEGMYV